MKAETNGIEILIVRPMPALTNRKKNFDFGTLFQVQLDSIADRDLV